MPALAQRISMPPNASAAAFAAFSIDARSVTSPATAFAPCPISAAARFPSSRWRETTVTLAPASASDRAIPLPIPLLPPVTSAFRPLIESSIVELPSFFAARKIAAPHQPDQTSKAKQQDGSVDSRQRPKHRYARRATRHHLGIEILRHGAVGTRRVEGRRKISPGEQESEGRARENARKQNGQGKSRANLQPGRTKVECCFFECRIETVDLEIANSDPYRGLGGDRLPQPPRGRRQA